MRSAEPVLHGISHGIVKVGTTTGGLTQRPEGLDGHNSRRASASREYRCEPCKSQAGIIRNPVKEFLFFLI